MTWGVTGLVVDRGHARAVDGVTLEARRGEVAAVVGGDGAGKTTLLRTLAGGLAASQGEVRAPGLERIGFMPTGNGVWRDLSVDENVAFVAAAHGMRGEGLARRRQEVLEAAGLTEATDRLARHLSGGMRQKLAFSLAVLHEPELIILDEPSTGVDPVSRIDLWRMIALAAAQDAAVVMASTYLDEAERASSVLVLDGGRPLLQGTPGEVLDGMPGHVAVAASRDDAQTTWRRGRTVRQWSAEEPPPGEPRAADLEDAVVGAAIAKEAGRG